MKYSLLIFLFFCITKNYAQQTPYLLVGTYTSGKSEGIYVYQFNEDNANTQYISVVKSSNPSYLAIAPNKKFVYAVNENADSTINPIGGYVTSYSFDKDKGILTEINRQPSGGKHPCYVTVDKLNKWLFAGNYTSGSIGLLSINNDGSLNSPSQIVQHIGSGPNVQRQQSAHVHATVLSSNNKYLFVPDLGIDKIMTYSFNNKKGNLKQIGFTPSLPGSGPRHFTFANNNKFAYLMEELLGNVICYKVKHSSLKFVQRINAYPKNYVGIMGSADIHISPNGLFLYCSNRGESNSISIFKINHKNGKLNLIGNQPTLGLTPRNFNFSPSGNYLLVANQNSNNIIIFKVDKQSGLLTDTKKNIMVPNPVCIKWIVND